jgi:hypothetical protein
MGILLPTVPIMYIGDMPKARTYSVFSTQPILPSSPPPVRAGAVPWENIPDSGSPFIAVGSVTSVSGSMWDWQEQILKEDSSFSPLPSTPGFSYFPKRYTHTLTLCRLCVLEIFPSPHVAMSTSDSCFTILLGRSSGFSDVYVALTGRP